MKASRPGWRDVKATEHEETRHLPHGEARDRQPPHYPLYSRAPTPAVAPLDNNKIAARVAELQAEHRARHDITVGSLTDELERARQLAHRNGQAAAAVSATLGKARLHGLLTNKIRVGADESLAAVMKAIDGKTRVFNPASN